MGPAGTIGTAGAAGAPGAIGPAGAVGTVGPMGPAGAVGTVGPMGPAGAVGTVGPMGPAGAVGSVGPMGPAGTVGGVGPAGVSGAMGPAGPTGGVGPAGAIGPAGVTGDTGAAGAAGTNGVNGINGTGGTSQYGYIYNLSALVVAIEAPVLFSDNGIKTAGITHSPGTSDISIASAGDYKVTFSVSGVEPGQFALFLNGGIIAGTVYGSGAGTQQNTGQAIVAIGPNDILTLRNHSSAAAVTLQTLAGGTATSVNASVLLQKLN